MSSKGNILFIWFTTLWKWCEFHIFFSTCHQATYCYKEKMFEKYIHQTYSSSLSAVTPLQWQPFRDWEFLRGYEFWAAGGRFTLPGHPVNAPPQAITIGDLALLSFQPLLTATQVSLAFPFLLQFYKSFFSVGSRAWSSPLHETNREGRLVKVA